MIEPTPKALARQFERSKNMSSFEPRVIDALAAAGIRIGFTRDLRINLKDPANAKYAIAAEKYSALFCADPRIIRREIVNWNLADQEDIGSPYHLPDDQTQIHCTLLYNGVDSAPVFSNLVNPSTGNYFVDANSWLYRFIQRRGFESVSTHLAYSAEKIKADPFDKHSVPDSPVLPRAEVLRRVLDCLSGLKTNLNTVGYNGSILIETLDYAADKIGGKKVSAYEHVTRPDFLSEVIRRTGLGLLLDVAHLLISAENYQYSDSLAYVAEMLGGRADLLREIHIAVPEQAGTRWLDSHWSLFGHLGSGETDKILNILKYLVLSKPAAQPVYLNFESPAETAHLDAIFLVLFLREIMGF